MSILNYQIFVLEGAIPPEINLIYAIRSAQGNFLVWFDSTR